MDNSNLAAQSSGSNNSDNPNNYNNSTPNAPASNPAVKENIPLGILGAFIGSLAGLLAIVLLDRLGFVASISGVIMAACTLLLYEKFAKKISKTGIIISVAIMIIMVLIAENLAFSIQAVEEIKELGYVADFSDIFFNFYSYLSEGLFDAGTYVTGLVMVYAFTALGAAGIIVGKYKTAPNKK